MSSTAVVFNSDVFSSDVFNGGGLEALNSKRVRHAYPAPAVLESSLPRTVGTQKNQAESPDADRN